MSGTLLGGFEDYSDVGASSPAASRIDPGGLDVTVKRSERDVEDAMGATWFRRGYRSSRRVPSMSELLVNPLRRQHKSQRQR